MAQIVALADPAPQNPAASSHRHADRVESLDLLRGLAALAVMIPHFFMYQAGVQAVPEVVSVVAVEVFFVLSGFVLAPQILLCMRRADLATLRTFLIRRWMRTIPSYLVALIAISAIFREIGSADFVRYSTYTQNLFRQHNVRDYYPVAWSLSVEEWFYVCFPALLVIFTRWSGDPRIRNALTFTLLFVASVALLRLTNINPADWGAQVRRVVVFRIDAIAYGFLLYLAVSRTMLLTTRWALPATAILLAGACYLTFAINAAIGAGDPHPWIQAIHPFASAAFGSAAILFFLAIRGVCARPLARSFSTYCGKISYPVYLFHLAVLYALAPKLSEVGLVPQFVIFSAATIGLASAFHYIFEKPILAARPRYRPGAV